MKKNYLLILFALFLAKAYGQNCNFTTQTSPGTTVVGFLANPTFLQGNYSFTWSFGDGFIDSSSASPVHTYNGTGPYVACCNVYDSVHTFVCASCDTIYLGITVTCTFSYSISGSTFTFVALGAPAGQISWDFGDGGSDTGATVQHNYGSGGTYAVTMTVSDPTTHSILCQSFQNVSAPGSNSCSFGYNVNVATAIFYLNNMGSAATVHWDFGDGMIGSGLQASHTYFTGGLFNVCVTVVDTSGNSSTSCQYVLVNSTPGNCYFTSSVLNQLNPNEITFTAYPAYPSVPPGPSSHITWDFGDGTTDTGTVVTHIYTSPGTYSVTMTEYDPMGGFYCQFISAVTILGANTCFYTYSPSLANPLTINFQANGVSAFAWDFGDGSVDSGNAVSHTYATAGIYNVCMWAGTPGTSNYCSYCMLITVGSTTNYCTISYFPDPFSPNTITFSSTSSSPSSMIAWDFGDGTYDVGQSVTHTYAAGGTYVVCVVERDSLQNITCQNCITVTVGTGNGVLCQASFVATSFGLDAYFIDMSLNQTAPVTWAWDFGDGTTSNLQFPQHTYAVPGVYNVCLVVADALCSDSFCAPLLVDTNGHNPSGGCNAFFAYIQLAPYQVTVVNLSNGFNLSFDWDYGDGSPHDTTPYPSHLYTTTGSYNLCLTVTGPNGCVSTYCDSLNVDSLGNIYRRGQAGFILNVVSPAQLTGVKEVETAKTYTLYPNPFSNELHVVMNDGTKKATDYRIFSIQGAEVMRGKLEGMDGTIRTQSLTPGVYLLEVTMNDGSRGFQRVIKN